MSKNEIYFLQAECGDSARIRFYGNDNRYHNIMIDAGYERTFRHVIADQLDDMIEKGEIIDLWVVSHIHDDHIGGVIKYIKTIKTKEYKDIVDKWYYNPPRISLTDTKISDEVCSPMSVKQGDELYQYLLSQNNLLEYDITNNTPNQSIYGLEITILSPSPSKLKRLRNKYRKDIPFEKMENEVISVAVGRPKTDYNIPIENFDLKNWSEDDSIENGSSIVMLTRYEGITILWLADAHPSDVTKGLKQLGYSKVNKLHCDVVKVSHHGSKGNNSDELYSLIECSNYVFSVNGENRHSLPSKESIARILRNENRSKDSFYSIYFNYDNETLRSIFDIDKDGFEEIFNCRLFFSNDKWIKYPFEE